MMKAAILPVFAALSLAACAPMPMRSAPPPQGVAIYRLTEADLPDVQFRMLDSLNLLRQRTGRPALALDAGLNAAAATHARDIAVQNRPWHFGSDGSSPIDRAARAGYRGDVLGETLSETYESELETLRAWMAAPETRTVLMDPVARDLGFAFFQEDTGKVWWVLITGNGGRAGATNAPRG